jgi:hypothetical protein
MCDQSTAKIAQALHAPFKAIGKDLSRDYGGTMEHLWIDLELIRSHAERRPPWTFRFQRRVSGRSSLTGLTSPDRHNVGHYSVRPDFDELASIPLDSVVGYVLSLIYASTTVLIANQKRLGGFDAQAFRTDFVSACNGEGYPIRTEQTCQPGGPGYSRPAAARS